MHHAQTKSVYNTSTAVQNEIFFGMTILKPLVHPTSLTLVAC